MVRAADWGGGDAGFARGLWQFRDRGVERRKCEAVGGVNGDDRRPRARHHGRCKTVDLADLGLRGVARHTRKPMTLEAVGLRPHERTRDAACIVLTRAATEQRFDNEIFRFGERQGRHQRRTMSPAVTTMRITSVVPVTVAMWRQPSAPMAVSEVPRPSAAIAISSPQVDACPSAALIGA